MHSKIAMLLAIAFMVALLASAVSAGAQEAPPEECTITGTGGGDVLRGTSGDDVICGLGGGDLIDGREGTTSCAGARAGTTWRAA